LPDPGEEKLDAAQREFLEETDIVARGPFLELSPLKQKSGKLVQCWAFEGAPDSVIAPGTSQFEMEWPPRSGKRASFPEVDEARLFEVNEALEMILPGQAPFIRALVALVT
jgi:predicted NUDIX family NTP pyrophosphohydrolase